MALVSLFTGAMGLDIGLQRGLERQLRDSPVPVPPTGPHPDQLHTVAAVEIDPAARATIHANAPRPIQVYGDVTGVTAADLLRDTGLRVGETLVLSGGPPCQPFSTAGRRAALNDPRGSLFRDYVRLIGGLQPRFFVMENVRGLLSSALRHREIARRGAAHAPLTDEEQPGSAFRVILQEFGALGYSYTYGLLNAADYGVPQQRERVIIIGSRDHEPLHLPAPTHARGGTGGLKPWATLRDALRDLHDPSPVFPAYPESRLRFLRLVPEGGNWRSLPPELHPEAMGGAFHSGGGKVGFYRRLAWDRPAPTVTTSPSQKATDMCHPTEHRPISVREAARLQGFPDDWMFTGSVSDQYRQIGNAVPVGLGEAVGGAIMRAMLGTPAAGRDLQPTLF